MLTFTKTEMSSFQFRLIYEGYKISAFLINLHARSSLRPIQGSANGDILYQLLHNVNVLLTITIKYSLIFKV